MRQFKICGLCSLTLVLSVLQASGWSQADLYQPLGIAHQSAYGMIKENGEQKVSTTLFDAYGNPLPGAGRFAITGLVTPNGSGPRASIADGRVWTTRVESIEGIDLSTPGKITDNPRFSLDSFRKHPAVMEFGNGFAVNLFGAINQQNRIISGGKEGTYLNAAKKPLPARLISKAKPGTTPVAVGDKIVALRQSKIMSEYEIRGVVEAGTQLTAKDVRGNWILVSTAIDGATVTGWIRRSDTLRAGVAIEERILRVEGAANVDSPPLEPTRE